MWLRIDLINQNKLVETDLSLTTIEELVKTGGLIKIKRSLVLVPHQGEGEQKGLAAIQPKDAHPLYTICNDEFISAGSICSFGVVDEESDTWKMIAEKGLGEKHIITPSKKIVLK